MGTRPPLEEIVDHLAVLLVKGVALLIPEEERGPKFVEVTTDVTRAELKALLLDDQPGSEKYAYERQVLQLAGEMMGREVFMLVAVECAKRIHAEGGCK